MFSSFTIGLGAIALILVAAALTFIGRFMLIRHPHPGMSLAGRKRKSAGSTDVRDPGYNGGHALQAPVQESTRGRSAESIPLALTVTNAYAKGGIPVHVEAIAKVRGVPTQPVLGHAVDPFLDKALAALSDTLGSHVCGVLAKLTPEAINEDPVAFAQRLIDEADRALAQRGLALDALKIENVSDEAGYLDPFPWPRLRVEPTGRRYRHEACAREDFAPRPVGEKAFDPQRPRQKLYQRLQPMGEAESGHKHNPVHLTRDRRGNGYGRRRPRFTKVKSPKS